MLTRRRLHLRARLRLGELYSAAVESWVPPGPLVLSPCVHVLGADGRRTVLRIGTFSKVRLHNT